MEANIARDRVRCKRTDERARATTKICYGFPMKFGAWYERLLAAIEADGRSLREISRTAGLGPNFISQMKKDKKGPSVDNFLKLTEALNVSAIYVISGVSMSSADERLLEHAAGLGDEDKEALLRVMRAARGAGQSALTPGTSPPLLEKPK